ncbi:unnamed protein product [Spirodela intermedia]|uniref:Uncharacterized protein n=1 Tax=Spirodela intermedia TaxID=51605 RepID=A0A7I8JR55_SPIIN|nr:unnamed protein product [Spirodela intermedia]CAA6672255.1 unnamed protein product [Spirodela intermedia]
MGAGLVMLLTRSSSEFRKMAALRKEMESLMEDCKTAIQKNSQNPNPNLTSCGGSDSRAETEQSNLTDDASHGGDAERWRRRRPLMREEMEAELESELELLHINLVKQEVSGEGSAPYGSSTAGLESEEQGEEEEEEEKAAVEIAGVSPRALTRKLHELLERRQQERIEELESDLELARAKLREKEMEISLWRETARVVSQRAVSHTQRII